MQHDLAERFGQKGALPGAAGGSRAPAGSSIAQMVNCFGSWARSLGTKSEKRGRPSIIGNDCQYSTRLRWLIDLTVWIVVKCGCIYVYWKMEQFPGATGIATPNCPVADDRWQVLRKKPRIRWMQGFVIKP
ncbi:MAG: hypothetical protein R3D69_14120 [Xanthobacteraceae bacterium]